MHPPKQTEQTRFVQVIEQGEDIKYGQVNKVLVHTRYIDKLKQTEQTRYLQIIRHTPKQTQTNSIDTQI